MAAAGNASVNISSAMFASSTSQMGGSACVFGTAKLSIVDTLLTGGRASEGDGGCLVAYGASLLQVMDTNMSNCTSAACQRVGQ